MKTNGKVNTQNNRKPRKLRVKFANGTTRARDIKIWMRFFTRTDTNFL